MKDLEEAFKAKYRNKQYQCFAFDQSEVLPKGTQGSCLAFSYSYLALRANHPTLTPEQYRESLIK